MIEDKKHFESKRRETLFIKTGTVPAKPEYRHRIERETIYSMKQSH